LAFAKTLIGVINSRILVPPVNFVLNFAKMSVMPEQPFSNINQLLETRVADFPDKDFLFSEGDGRVFTYRAFEVEVSRAAALLASLSIQKGDRVSLYLTNSVEYLIFYFACFKLGAWAAPVNAHLKAHEIEFIIANSESSVVVTQTDLLPRIEAARNNISMLRHIIVIEDGGFRIQDSIHFSKNAVGNNLKTDSETLSSANPKSKIQNPKSDDVAIIIYTSGTTGKPKGVLLTHGNLLINAREIADWLTLTETDRSLMIMPLFHVNALMTTGLAALTVGGSIVLAEKFSASRHWAIIAKYGVTYFGSVATMLSLLNQTHPQGVPDGCDTSSLRFALCGSAPVPVEVMKTYEALFDCKVIEGYGLSETSCRSTFNPIDERRKVGSVGLPIGNEMKIFDDNDNELAPGQVGEIVLRGANITKGYYKNDEANAAAFRSGWFHSGDLGYRDEAGFFYIVDRKSDMIIRGGENIYPREIDEVLYQHPKVKDAATIGVPDDLYGEEVKSFIVLKDGESVSEEEILRFCREQLADFKCPKRVAILEDIPKGPTGKLLKKELRELS
jgi:long-chain acyl-CoA synthetase